MRIKLIIDGATESDLRALLAAHNKVVNREVVGPQPTQGMGDHAGRPFVGVEGPECYGIETYSLTPAGAEFVLNALPVICAKGGSDGR